MKTVTIVLLISLSCNVYPQKSIFVRVYDLAGKKISKGHVVAITDTNLQLKKGNDTTIIPVRSISSIKSKHSGWNNILVGTSVGIIAGGILGSVNPPTKSSGGTFTWAGSSASDEFADGLGVGVILGTAIGGITTGFKNSKTYLINGDLTKWKAFQILVASNK
jgi:hypothetical protein